MKKKILFLCLIFSWGTLAYLSFKAGTNYLEFKRKQQELEKRKVAWKILEEDIKKELDDFRDQAGIVIKDLDTGWQILINQDRLFPPASLVKIPIMAACFYAADKGKIKLDETLKLKTTHKVSGSGILKDVPVGAELTIRKLIELMIIESDNTATNMLIGRLGFDYLNDCFKELRLKDTNISRKMMDFKSRKEGRENFTTVSNLAFLLEEIYNEKLIEKVYSHVCLELLKKQKIRDRIPAKLPKYTVVAHKTGLEFGICHDAGIVFTPKGDFLICVLTKHHNKTAKLAKEFIAQIALETYNYYQRF